MEDICHGLESAEAAIFTSISELKKRNVSIGDSRTSVTLEPQVWSVLHEIAEEMECDIHKLCSFINDRKHPDASLASAIRVYLLSYLNIKLKKYGNP